MSISDGVKSDADLPLPRRLPCSRPLAKRFTAGHHPGLPSLGAGRGLSFREPFS